jgi:hypothetical protein
MNKLFKWISNLFNDHNTTKMTKKGADDHQVHLTPFSMQSDKIRREKDFYAYDFSIEGLRRGRR